LNRKFITLIIVLIFNQSCTLIYRGIRYGQPSIDAYKIFPNDTIHTGVPAFKFKDGNAAILNKAILSPDDVKGIRTFPDSLPFTLDYFLNRTATTAFIVIRNDSIIFEKYYKGYDRGKISTIFSVSKSVTSLLVGLAVDGGYISSVNDPITKYIPELKGRDPKFERLTVKYLLNMCTGLKFKESYTNPFQGMARYYYGVNQMRKIKKLKFENEPGVQFKYQSASTALLGIAVENATRMPLAKYLEEKIWKPLGMENEASWSLDDNRHRIAKAYGGLNTTAIDLVKIGRLYLNNGNWNGKQIVSKAWVKNSVIPNVQGNGYQYQWYIVNSDMKENYPDSTSALNAWNKPDNKFSKYHFSIWQDILEQDVWRIRIFYPCFYAFGFDGQELMVFPEKNLIMVRFGEGENFGSIMYLLSTRL